MGLKSAIFWFVLVLCLTFTWWILDLPPEQELIELITNWLHQYGLPLLFVGALLESLLFVGFYFPGSIIIFLGVGLAASVDAAVLSVLAVSGGMVCGYTINYGIGRYGWYRLFLKLGMQAGVERAERNMLRSDVRYVFYTFWNPGLAAFTATAAGILHVPPQRFLALGIAAIIVWNTFWGVLVYSLGAEALVLLDFRLILFLIAMWILFECVWLYKKRYFTD